MRAMFTKIMACLLVCCLYSSFAQAQWRELPRSTTNALFTAMTVDQRDGTLYSSHSDGKVRARKLNAQGEWEFLGPEGGFTPGNAEWSSLAVDDAGVLYAAFTDNADGAGGKASVMKFNSVSGEWEQVGPVHVSAGATRHTQITFDKNNVPYVAFRDIGAPTGEVKVLKYKADGNVWVDPVTESATEFTPISTAGAAFTRIAFGNDNTLYVAYQDLNSSDKATVKKLIENASNYEVVGTEKFSETAAEFISIAVDNDNNVYITYGLKATPLNVKKFDSNPQVNSWVNVGSTAAPFELPLYHNSNPGEIRTNLFIDKSNKPVVGYLASTWRGLMYRYNGSAWVAIGGTEGLPDHHRWPSYAIDLENNKYYVSGRGGGGTSNGKNIIRVFDCGPIIGASPVAAEVNSGENATFTANATGANITFQWQVNKNDGAGFINVTDGDSYSGTATETLTVIAATVPMNGYKYRLMATSDCGSNASASATLGVIPPTSAWTGGAASFGNSQHTSIDVDSKGIPYHMARHDDPATVGVVDEKLFVTRKVNGQWEKVGEPVSAGSTDWYPYVKIDKNDVPYVAYQDMVNGSKLTVKKFDGTNWIAVGGIEGITEEAIRFPFIDFDNNNVPHVFYRDITNSKGKVVKFENGAWTQLGPDVSSGNADHTSIDFDAENTPFVGYIDNANGNRMTVRKYNGTEWVAVGTPGFDASGNTGSVGYPFMALDNNDVPHVVFNDNTLGKGVVMKYNGTSWVHIGTGNGITVGPIRPDGYRNGNYAEPRPGPGTSYLFFGVDNRPYVSFNDINYLGETTGGGRGVFMQYYNGAWAVVGGTPVMDRNTNHYGSGMDKTSGTLYYGFRHSSDPGRFSYVREFVAGYPISYSPNDGEVLEGESISLKGLAAGSNLRYQWQIDAEGNGRYIDIPESSENYSGTNTTTLVINPANMGMNGKKYRFIAIGEWGASASKSATLTVTPATFCFAPVISTQPASLELCPGTNARFVAAISQGSEPVFQWQVSTDGTNFTNVENGGVYSGATTATLNINNLPNSLNGNLYRLVVKTGCSDAEAISSNATLTVFDAPTIVTQPNDPGTVCPGTETVISVQAIGRGINYKWQLSTNGVDFTDINNGEVYAGVGTNALTVKNPTPAMSGYKYRVVTSGACQPIAGGNVSQARELKVYQPLNAGVIAGKQVICYNTVPAGLTSSEVATGSNNTAQENYQYQWQYSHDKAEWSDVDGAQEVSYSPAALTQTTYFRRKVTNVACTTPAVAYTEPVKVIVNDEVLAGEIAWSSGEGEEVFKGSLPKAITSIIAATGGNVITYQWEYSTDGTTFSPINGATAKDLAPAELMETRHFRRLATFENGCGTVISNTITITVKENAFELSMIPNAIFPKSNSMLNKTWGVSNYHYSGKMSIRVLDQKGNTVFSAESADKEWDGTYKGELVPAGTYYFSIEGGNKKFNGPLKVIY